MKLLLVFFAAAVVTASAITEEQKAKWKKWSEDCQAQSGVTSETIDKLRNNQFDTVDDKVKSHSLCFGKKSGLIKENGETDVEEVKARLHRILSDDAEVDKIVNKCVVKKASHEETAFEVFKCLRENQPKFSPV